MLSTAAVRFESKVRLLRERSKPESEPLSELPSADPASADACKKSLDASSDSDFELAY